MPTGDCLNRPNVRPSRFGGASSSVPAEEDFAPRHRPRAAAAPPQQPWEAGRGRSSGGRSSGGFVEESDGGGRASFFSADSGVHCGGQRRSHDEFIEPQEELRGARGMSFAPTN